MIKPRDFTKMNIERNEAAKSAAALVQAMQKAIEAAKTTEGKDKLLQWMQTVQFLDALVKGLGRSLDELNAEALDQWKDPEQNPDWLKKRILWLEQRKNELKYLLETNGIKTNSQ